MNSSIGRAFTFFRPRDRIGPATMIAGIAMRIPYTSVFPMSAWNIVAMAVGAGCGGR